MKNDVELIREYGKHHEGVWPEIIKSIKDSGIINMQIYRFETSLFMIMGVDETINFDKKQQTDLNNAKVHKWEELMAKYQQPFQGSIEGEKWKPMDKYLN